MYYIVIVQVFFPQVAVVGWGEGSEQWGVCKKCGCKDSETANKVFHCTLLLLLCVCDCAPVCVTPSPRPPGDIR